MESLEKLNHHWIHQGKLYKQILFANDLEDYQLKF